MVEVLKRAGKDSRLQVDRDGNIPIMNAIESHNVKLCQELLKVNSDEQMKTTKVSKWSFDPNFLGMIVDIFSIR